MNLVRCREKDYVAQRLMCLSSLAHLGLGSAFFNEAGSCGSGVSGGLPGAQIPASRRPQV